MIRFQVSLPSIHAAARALAAVAVLATGCGSQAEVREDRSHAGTYALDFEDWLVQCARVPKPVIVAPSEVLEEDIAEEPEAAEPVPRGPSTPLPPRRGSMLLFLHPDGRWLIYAGGEPTVSDLRPSAGRWRQLDGRVELHLDWHATGESHVQGQTSLTPGTWLRWEPGPGRPVLVPLRDGAVVLPAVQPTEAEWWLERTSSTVDLDPGVWPPDLR